MLQECAPEDQAAQQEYVNGIAVCIADHSGHRFLVEPGLIGSAFVEMYIFDVYNCRPGPACY